MKEVIVNSKPGCAYCTSAKEWLKLRNIPFIERLHETRDEQLAFVDSVGNGVRTFPQIYVDGVRIGGFDDLKKSEHLFVDIEL